MVRRPREKPLLAYKINTSSVWAFAKTIPPMIPEHTRVSTRCLLWKPYYAGEREGLQESLSLASFASLEGPFHEVAFRDVSARQFKLKNYVTAYRADHSFSADVERHANQYFGCFLDLLSEKEKLLGKKIGPFSICSRLSKLIVTPDTYAVFLLTDTLECTTDTVGFQKPIITWTYRSGPLPPMKKPPADEKWKATVNSNKLSLSRLPAYGIYIFTCKAISNCLEQVQEIELDYQFTVSKGRTANMKTAKVIPRLVLVSKTIHIECPNILADAASQKMLARSLTWFRVTRKGNATESGRDSTPEVIMKHDLIKQAIERPSPNFADGNRLVNYKTLEGHFAMDINPTTENDYGYYGCILDIYEQGKSESWRMDQVAPFPVCIVQAGDNPTLNLTGLSGPGNCYRVGDEVSVLCSANAYQVFCESSDQPLGIDLIATEVRLTITYPEFEQKNEIINLIVLADIVLPGDVPRLWLTLRKYSFQISWQHNDISVACETKPALKKSLRNKMGMEGDFNNTFESLKPQLMRKTSQKICVVSAPRNLRIDPPPPDQNSLTEVEFELKVGALLMCFADGNPTPKVEMDIQPLREAAIAVAVEFGLQKMNAWKDMTRSPPDWPVTKSPGQIGLQIGSTNREGNPLSLYVGICRASNQIDQEIASTQRVCCFWFVYIIILMNADFRELMV